MADDELTFRGSGAHECTDFIRKIHKVAYEEGRQRDSEWIADRAMICFADDALLWYDQQSSETQADWVLLRRALLTHYGTPNPAARPAPAPVGSSSRVLKDMPSVSAAESPSAALNATDSTPTYRIKVVAPSYVGYVCKTYGTGTRGRHCILASNRDGAMVVKETFDPVASCLALQIEGSQRNDSYGRESYERLCLASLDGNSEYLPATWRGWLIAARQLSAQTYSINDDSQPNAEVVPAPWMTDKDGRLSAARLYRVSWWPSKKGLQFPNRGDSPETWKTFSDKFIPVIFNAPSGDTTLHFWSRRVWNDNDEQFVADMYL